MEKNYTNTIARLISNSSKYYIAKSNNDNQKGSLGSSSVSSIVSSSVSSIVNNDSEKLREIYCKIFDDQDKLYKNNQSWWIDQFQEASQIYLDDFKKQADSKEINNDWNLTISCNGQFHDYSSNSNKRLILFGRKHGCDILIQHTNQFISRLHAMIFIIPEINKIVIVDPGSISGIVTLLRSSDNQLINSLPKSRAVLVFDITEMFVIKLGNIQLGFNLKDCIICMDKPRECTFQCGHHIVCNDCRVKLNKCPLCKKILLHDIKEFRLMTNVRNNLDK